MASTAGGGLREGKEGGGGAFSVMGSAGGIVEGAEGAWTGAGGAGAEVVGGEKREP